jgi:hypothetical protein
MERDTGNQNETYWANGGAVPHQPVVIVGEQDPEADRKSNNLSVASLVFGILSVLLFFVIGLSLILGLVGLVTGIVSLAQRRAGHGAAVAGVILSAVGIVAALIVLAIFILALFMAV